MKHFLDELHDLAVTIFDYIGIFGNVFWLVHRHNRGIIFEKVLLSDLDRQFYRIFYPASR